MTGLKAISLALLSSTLIFYSTAWAQASSQPAKLDQANLVRFPPSSILCIEDDATGFNWRNKKWEQTNFIPSGKFIIRKIEIDKYINSEDRLKNEILFCGKPEVITGNSDNKKNFIGLINACYEIKVMGEKGNAFDSRSCSEWWEDGRLEKISCSNHSPQIYFQPEGPFIKFPFHTDVDKSRDKKGSLAISVGNCSIIK